MKQDTSHVVSEAHYAQVVLLPCQRGPGQDIWVKHGNTPPHAQLFHTTGAIYHCISRSHTGQLNMSSFLVGGVQEVLREGPFFIFLHRICAEILSSQRSPRFTQSTFGQQNHV